jgi:hypothetical protein
VDQGVARTGKMGLIWGLVVGGCCRVEACAVNNSPRLRTPDPVCCKEKLQH